MGCYQKLNPMKAFYFILVLFIVSCSGTKHISKTTYRTPFSKLVTKNANENLLIFSYDFAANHDSSEVDYFTGIYGYDLRRDSVIEIIKPEQEIVYLKLRYSKNDSLFYAYKMVKENNVWGNSIMRINRFTKKEENLMGGNGQLLINHYDLNAEENAIYLASAQELSKSSPVYNTKTYKNFLILKFKIEEKEFEATGVRFLIYGIYGFHMDRQRNALLSNMVGISNEAGSKYENLTIFLEPFEIHKNKKLVSKSGEILEKPGSFTEVIPSDFDNSVYYCFGGKIYKKNIATNESILLYDYVANNNKGSWVISQIIDYPSLKKSVISIYEKRLRKVVFVEIDENGKQLRKIEPDMTFYKNKYIEQISQDSVGSSIKYP
jgi:hypothetical protein